jgi:hypothetical protein
METVFWQLFWTTREGLIPDRDLVALKENFVSKLLSFLELGLA